MAVRAQFRKPLQEEQDAHARWDTDLVKVFAEFEVKILKDQGPFLEWLRLPNGPLTPGRTPLGYAQAYTVFKYFLSKRQQDALIESAKSFIEWVTNLDEGIPSREALLYTWRQSFTHIRSSYYMDPYQRKLVDKYLAMPMGQDDLDKAIHQLLAKSASTAKRIATDDYSQRIFTIGAQNWQYMYLNTKRSSRYWKKEEMLATYEKSTHYKDDNGNPIAFVENQAAKCHTDQHIVQWFNGNPDDVPAPVEEALPEPAPAPVGEAELKVPPRNFWPAGVPTNYELEL
jgi:hypothetical protein